MTLEHENPFCMGELDNLGAARERGDLEERLLEADQSPVWKYLCEECGDWFETSRKCEIIT